MLCLPIQHVHGWLFSIQIAKVKPEAKELLLAFKKECYAVLFGHFFGKNKNIESNIKRRFEIGNRMKEIDTLCHQRVKREKST